jgi:hypothetical protein
MIYHNTKRLRGKRLWSALLSILLISILGCGEKTGKADGRASGSGALQLSLNWNPKPAAKLDGRALTPSPSDNVCEDYDIDSIYARLTDAADEEVASATWACEAHSGRLDGIKAGSGYRVAVDGLIGTDACWRGEALDVGIAKDQTTSVEIAMYYVSCGRDLPIPEVVSVYPLENAVDVPINARVTATFSNPMVVASVLAESAFTLSAGQVVVDGEVEYDETSHTLTFTPRGALAANTAFTAKISSGVEDKNGHSMPAAYTWSFTSGSVSVLSWGEGEWGNAVWRGDE